MMNASQSEMAYKSKAAAGRSLERRIRHYTLALLISIALIAATVLLWKRVVISIRPGEAGVIYRFFTGTDMERIYGEGLNLIWPWNRMNIYNMRYQTTERNLTFLTKDGLPVDMQVAIRYRPDIRTLNSLHVNVGPDYANIIVLPEVEAVLRRSIAQYSAEEVYMSARGLLETIALGSLNSVEDRNVIIDDVLVKSIKLPDQVQEAIVNKQALSEQDKAYLFRIEIERKEAQRKLIEANGIRDAQRIIGESLTQDLLRWQGIQATRDLATSNNAKTVVIGSGKDGLPLILGDR